MMNLEAVTGEVKLTAAQQRNLFVELCYSGLDAATASLDLAAIFQDLGYFDTKKATLCIPRLSPPRNSAPKCCSCIAQAQTQAGSMAAIHESVRGTKIATCQTYQSHFPQCFALLSVVRSSRQDAFVILFQQPKILSCMRDIISVRDSKGGVVTLLGHYPPVPVSGQGNTRKECCEEAAQTCAALPLPCTHRRKKRATNKEGKKRCKTGVRAAVYYHSNAFFIVFCQCTNLEPPWQPAYDTGNTFV